MGSKASLWLVMAAAGLVLFAFAGPSEEYDDRVVLNPDAPQALRSGSTGDLDKLPQPVPITAPTTASVPTGKAGGIPPAGYPDTRGGEAAGVWATPAQFSETD